MNWDVIASIISGIANAATAAGLWFLVRQVRTENKSRAKEASQAVWDLLAAEDVYTARLYLEYNDPPADFESVMKEDSPWARAALKCYLAYQKAAILVIRHKWMEPEMFAEQWGYSTMVVWKRLKPWIRWYSETHSYPAFGDSIEQLVTLVAQFDDGATGFRKDQVGVPGVQGSVSPDASIDRLHFPFSSVAQPTESGAGDRGPGILPPPG